MPSYKFKGLDNEGPRELEYTLYLASMDGDQNYSPYHEVTVTHPGIKKLEFSASDITPTLSGFLIHLPNVYTKDSTEVVYPAEPVESSKEILAYRIHVTNQDTETSFTVDVPSHNLSNETYFLGVEANTNYEIKVGAYDSVYHPEFGANSEESGYNKIYEETISDPVILKTRSVNDAIEHQIIVTSTSSTDSRSTATLQTTIWLSGMSTTDNKTKCEVTMTSLYEGTSLTESRAEVEIDTAP